MNVSWSGASGKTSSEEDFVKNEPEYELPDVVVIVILSVPTGLTKDISLTTPELERSPSTSTLTLEPELNFTLKSSNELCEDDRSFLVVEDDVLIKTVFEAVTMKRLLV